MTRRAVIAVCVLVALAAAPAAQAKRAATPHEAKAIRTAVKAFITKPHSPAAGSRLLRISVSTVNQRYALATLRTPEAARPGKAILRRARPRRARSTWRVVTFGVAGFAFNGVPVKVLNDLLGATICDCY